MQKSRQLVAFIGKPGCGKGTQADFLRKIGWEVLTMSKLLQGKRDPNSPNLVNNELVTEIFVRAFLQIPTNRNVVSDGFPRTIEQCKALLRLQNQNLSIRFIVFQITDELVIERIRHRKKVAEYQARPDDQDSVVLERLLVYKMITEPIVEYLKRYAPSKVFEINAEESVHLTRRKLSKALSVHTLREVK